MSYLPPIASDFTYTYDSLHDEVRKDWSGIQKECAAKVKQLSIRDEIRRAYKAYTNSMSSRMPLILLGSDKMRENQALIANFGTLATNPQYPYDMIKKIFIEKQGMTKGKTLNQRTEEHLTSGAIINDSNWWIFRNDLFILGGIHANKDFHIEYSGMTKGLPANELLWDKKENRPRALGREIIMLKAAGYTPAIYNDGVVFIPPTTPCSAIYTQMRTVIKECTLLEIQNYLHKPKGYPITQAGSPSLSSMGGLCCAIPSKQHSLPSSSLI